MAAAYACSAGSCLRRERNWAGARQGKQWHYIGLHTMAERSVAQTPHYHNGQRRSNDLAHTEAFR